MAIQQGGLRGGAASEPTLDAIQRSLDVPPAFPVKQRELLGAGRHEAAGLDPEQPDPPSLPGERPQELGHDPIQVGAHVGGVPEGP